MTVNIILHQLLEIIFDIYTEGSYHNRDNPLSTIFFIFFVLYFLKPYKLKVYYFELFLQQIIIFNKS